MAKLTAAKRKAMPASEFGMPGAKKYPMNDKAHAANAKGRASQQRKRGAISASTEGKIDAKADKVLGKGKAESKKETKAESKRPAAKRGKK